MTPENAEIKEITCFSCGKRFTIFKDDLYNSENTLICPYCSQKVMEPHTSFQIGDMVRNKKTDEYYIITNKIQGMAVATRTVAINQPFQWENLGNNNEEE